MTTIRLIGLPDDGSFKHGISWWSPLAGWINREQQQVVDYLEEENRVLREQLGGKRPRFTDDQRRRLAAKARKLGRSILRDMNTLVTPDTLLRWHRQLIARKYDGSANRGPGRPGVMNEIRTLVVRMATENKDWGYDRIKGALLNLGRRVSDTTIGRILRGAWYRTGPKAEPAWVLVHVSHGTLGPFGGGRLFHGGGLDTQRAGEPSTVQTSDTQSRWPGDGYTE